VKKAKPTEKAQERISPTEALNLLRRKFSPMDAAAQLTSAVHNRSCRLWCDGKVVKPHIAVTLIVKLRRGKNRRWMADIASTAPIGWEKPSYRWEFEIEEVKALLPQPQPQQKTEPQWAADPLAPPPRRRGPLTTHDWHAIDGEIARRCIDPKTGRVKVPKSENKLAEEVLNWLAGQGIKPPAPSAMRDAVKNVCAALRRVQK
jgi:hypothetical protein